MYPLFREKDINPTLVRFIRNFSLLFIWLPCVRGLKAPDFAFGSRKNLYLVWFIAPAVTPQPPLRIADRVSSTRPVHASKRAASRC